MQRIRVTKDNYQELALRTESRPSWARLSVNGGTAIQPSSDIEHRLAHAALGLVSEWGEMMQACDEVNQREELGDMFWYCAILSDALGENLSGIIFYEPGGIFETAAEDPEERSKAIERALISLGLCFGNLSDDAKKLLFYRSAEAGAYTAPISLKAALQNIVFLLQKMAHILGVDVVKDVMQPNIDKLSVRYPEKFSEEKAINRNLKAEYDALSANDS